MKSPSIFFFPLLLSLILHDSRAFYGHIPVKCIRNFNTKLSTSRNGITSPLPEPNLDYDWKNLWYPISYSSYVPHPKESAETVPVSIFDNPLVLWRDENGILYCADDVCPHRAAALSEGQVIDGKLECLYHGWQFEGKNGGDCVTIPQLEENASIPKRACLKMRHV
eukprot:CAMPEP_0204626164 /NCGR_PEP_ID=MMETSP0717-20131115/11832_1 /ASSEMBLY_ACC=CAM_ASM_000666 /TAXON_ID=230516 /ORGANISM="Chaetoceros curvisetus" /LENGTH=165 /DNA_ID=CAMNT_0051642041 /DNA_START=54 /DNA_END=547 /DNA_ORIENTATION=-